jgi:hypothetical protein
MHSIHLPRPSTASTDRWARVGRPGNPTAALPSPIASLRPRRSARLLRLEPSTTGRGDTPTRNISSTPGSCPGTRCRS